MLVDLHVHTKLSSDSNVSPEQYLEAAARNSIPLGAICFTEHRLFPTDPELDRTYAELSERFGIRIFKGTEADTDLGHLLIFGVTPTLMKRFDLDGRMHRAEHLIEAVHGEGGISIPAHPFRDSGYGARLDALLAKLGSALTAVETINGQNSHDQKIAAITAAEKLGMTAVGGSDAHFPTPKWFLPRATQIRPEVGTVEEPSAGNPPGAARPFQFPPDTSTTGE